MVILTLGLSLLSVNMNYIGLYMIQKWLLEFSLVVIIVGVVIIIITSSEHPLLLLGLNSLSVPQFFLKKRVLTTFNLVVFILAILSRIIFNTELETGSGVLWRHAFVNAMKSRVYLHKTHRSQKETNSITRRESFHYQVAMNTEINYNPVDLMYVLVGSVEIPTKRKKLHCCSPDLVLSFPEVQPCGCGF